MTDKPAHPPMKGVESSNIESVGHDGTHGYIRFKSGGLYKYQNAPADVFDAFHEAESPGKHFKAAVAGKYPHEKLQ